MNSAGLPGSEHLPMILMLWDMWPDIEPRFNFAGERPVGTGTRPAFDFADYNPTHGSPQALLRTREVTL